MKLTQAAIIKKIHTKSHELVYGNANFTLDAETTGQEIRDMIRDAADIQLARWFKQNPNLTTDFVAYSKVAQKRLPKHKGYKVKSITLHDDKVIQFAMAKPQDLSGDRYLVNLSFVGLAKEW